LMVLKAPTTWKTSRSSWSSASRCKPSPGVLINFVHSDTAWSCHGAHSPSASKTRGSALVAESDLSHAKPVGTPSTHRVLARGSRTHSHQPHRSQPGLTPSLEVITSWPPRI